MTWECALSACALSDVLQHGHLNLLQEWTLTVVRWHAVQLDWQSLAICNGVMGARALAPALPLGRPRAYWAAPGAPSTAVRSSQGSAGARGGGPEPDLSSMKDPQERRRQQRLAKTRVTAAASRYDY